MNADIATALRKAITAAGKSHYALARASGVASEVIDRFARHTAQDGGQAGQDRRHGIATDTRSRQQRGGLTHVRRYQG